MVREMEIHRKRDGGKIDIHTEEQQNRERVADIHTVRRVIAAFRPYNNQVILVLIAIIVTTLLGLINPLMIQRIFDDAIGKGDLNLLIIYVIIMFVTPAIAGVIGVGQSYLNNRIGQRVMRDFRNRLYMHLQKMSLRFFTGTQTGEIQSRLSNDVGGVQGVVTNTATSIVSNLSTAISTIIAMALLSPLLTFVSLGLLPLFLWITYKVGNARRQTSKETQKSLASLTAMTQETLSVSGMLLMKTFGRQAYAQERFEQENTHLANLEVRQQMIGRWFFMFMGTFFSVIPAVVYLIAGWQIIFHQPILGISMTFGTIVAFTTLQSRLFFPVGQLLNIQVEIQGALALFDRIFEYLDLPVDIKDKPDALHLIPAKVRGEITFKDVSFHYKRNEISERNDATDVVEPEERQLTTNGKRPHSISPEPLQTIAPVIASEETQRPTLNNISFTIAPGQMAALVGASGAGKTTITYLVPRLYDVDKGEIKIDGQDIRDITLASLGNLIGVVTQETYLFHASIRENLLYARPDATEEEIIMATKAAAIHERILEFEQGYDTIVGERGYKLSGGEKQRIAIARVILKNPRILILDEATSALDTHAERLIQTALEPLMRGRTTLAIAHRLSTILAADVILVVDKGEIVERGTHQELLARKGVYARLYSEQISQLPQEESIV